MPTLKMLSESNLAQLNSTLKIMYSALQLTLTYSSSHDPKDLSCDPLEGPSPQVGSP